MEAFCEATWAGTQIMVGVEAVGRNKLYPELLWSKLQDMDLEWGS